MRQPLSKEEIARLFHDEEVISRFNSAISKIPAQMIAERKERVEEPEVLVDVGRTIEEILEIIRIEDLERLSKFMTK